MDFSLFLLSFTLFWKLSWCIRCYKCEAERDYSPDPILCQHFDHSDKFIADCPYSTMCFKRETSYEFVNGVKTVSYQRGCAYQTLSGDQKKINGKWIQVKDIYEVYREGCEEDPSDVERSTKTIHCYCRGDLCNSATKTAINIFSITSTSIITWLVMS